MSLDKEIQQAKREVRDARERLRKLIQRKEECCQGCGMPLDFSRVYWKLASKPRPGLLSQTLLDTNALEQVQLVAKISALGMDVDAWIKCPVGCLRVIACEPRPVTRENLDDAFRAITRSTGSPAGINANPFESARAPKWAMGMGLKKLWEDIVDDGEDPK